MANLLRFRFLRLLIALKLQDLNQADVLDLYSSLRLRLPAFFISKAFFQLSFSPPYLFDELNLKCFLSVA